MDSGTSWRRPGRAASFVICAVVYAVALAAAVVTLRLWDEAHPLVALAVADGVATVVVFAASVLWDNASLYDPYWSVAPPLIGAYLVLAAAPEVPAARQALVLALVTLWAVRLTWNWARGWAGLGHEDWRYVDLRRQTGPAWWLVSFLGVHAFPTVLVFLGCLALWPALAAGAAPLGLLDAVAAAVTLGAIAVEWAADRQLHRFRASDRAPDALLTDGLWAWSRHPNYFGEIAFWCGLLLFAVAAQPLAAVPWWTSAGVIAMVALFLGVSIPLKERRMRARRGAAYEAHARRTSLLIPLPPRR